MEIRRCKGCGIEKEIIEFRLSKGKYRGKCKQCEKEYTLKYQKEHPEIIKAISHRTYIKNLDKYHTRNIANRGKISEYNKQYYEHNKIYYSDYHKKYLIEHRTELLKNNREWRKQNKEKVKKIQKKDYMRRMADPIEKEKHRVRNVIKNAFRNNKNKNAIIILCKCSADDLRKHLIKTFEENYGTKWDDSYLQDVQIDHIIPLSTAKTIDEVDALCYYTNLQLLTVADNLSKGSKILC